MFLPRDDISHIAQIILKGGLICYPTDTIWGIGCDALNVEAIARLSALRAQPAGQGYIVLVDSLDMLKQYVRRMNPRVETLLAYHQRPLTMVYPDPIGLPQAVRAADGSAAIRIVLDEFCRELIRLVQRPIVSAAACKAGEPYPPTFGAISSDILSGVDYVVKYRQESKEPRQPSTIARVNRSNELEFLRE
ncbi:MAG: Sua5/YciO/YrdC/YwlC family protein [Saprospiraceae bacterium]|nr:Sua5/YciO/YrdC/YwlC family protein [Saprospiraceae bacterium]MDW8482973.1 Sua5/YciO/YrdC/YwlC family protein [Saprospiraceae bacterium]